MIKNFLLLSLFCFSVILTKAQSLSELGTGANALNVDGFISAIHSDASGNVYATGHFVDANGYFYVARWNGNTWSELGTGANSLGTIALSGNAIIKAICSDASGNIYVGIGPYVVKWNGTTWSGLGTDANALNANNQIMTICSDRSGNIYAAGRFTTPTGYPYVAQWNGTTWSNLGFYANGYIYSLYADASGNVYAAGSFVNANGKQYVVKWNGTTWSELGTGANALNANNQIMTICSDPSGNIYTAGYFTDHAEDIYVAKWNGSTWSELGIGVNTASLNTVDLINSICSDASGNIYAAGSFTDAFDYTYVSKWNGNTWNKLGTGSNGLNANSLIESICSDTSGDIYAAGYFTDTNGKYYVAQFKNAEQYIATNVFSSNNNPISFYPNPTKNDLTIDSPEDGQVIIYNTLGEVMTSHNIVAGKSSISLGKIETGVYIVYLKGINNAYSPVKIVKD